MNDDAHTSLRPGEGLVVRQGNGMKRNVIDPPSDLPARGGLRYTLDMPSLGMLERLARVRFVVSEELANPDQQAFTFDANVEEALVQSVFASSEIEGEGVHLEDLPLSVAAVTQATQGASGELQQRLTAVKSILEAGIWAFTQDRRTFVDFEFVCELHERMFSATKPHLAGKIKSQNNAIRGGLFDIVMLDHSRAENALRELCRRTDARLQRSRQSSDEHSLLVIGEFVSDFLAIHPFGDGNGRTSRLLSSYLLDRCGYHFSRFYPLDTIILETRSQFYNALYDSQLHWYKPEEDLTPWMKYYIDAIFQQWQRAYHKAKSLGTKTFA